MIDVQYYKGKLRLPENWNEMDGYQLVRIASLLHSNLPMDVAEFEALRILSGKSKLFFMIVPLDVKAACIPQIQWLFEEIKLTKQLLPHYAGFYGPADDMMNLTMAEFHFCEMYYQELVVEKIDAALDNLVAVLYRKPKFAYDKARNKDGDIRTKFNPHETSYWSKQVAEWPRNVKQAILLFYDGCRQQWASDYDEVFTTAESNQNYYDGLYGMMRNIAGAKYGTFEQVEQMYVNNALLEVSYMVREEAEAKKMMQASQ